MSTKETDFRKSSLKVLKNCGWYEGRTKNINKLIGQYGENKIKLPKNIQMFIEEFSELKIPNSSFPDNYLKIVSDKYNGYLSFDFENGEKIYSIGETNTSWEIFSFSNKKIYLVMEDIGEVRRVNVENYTEFLELFMKGENIRAKHSEKIGEIEHVFDDVLNDFTRTNRIKFA